MKVLFIASILYRDNLFKEYERIVDCLKINGHEVLGDQALTITLDEIYKQTPEEKTSYLNLFKKQVSDCNVMCVEATFPSTMNIGFQVAYALQKNKPVIVLYKKNKYHSTLFDVLESDKLFYEEYTDQNLEVVLKNGLDFVDKKSDSRFNFYLPSNQVDYIDEVSKKDNLSRSAALRKVIAGAMEREKF